MRFCNGKNTADPAEINFDASSNYKKPYSVVGVYRKETISVGSFSPNSLGLYDMSGNVWEWTCSEWNNLYDERSENCNSINRAKDNNISRSLRGGSWFDVPGYARSANRLYSRPVNRLDIGFRLAQD